MDKVQSKLFEIRDRATFIPVLATKLQVPPHNVLESYLLHRAGFSPTGTAFVLVTRLHDMKSEYDPFKWPTPARTMFHAHSYIQQHFDELPIGAVIDVEYILGETDKPKQSERTE